MTGREHSLKIHPLNGETIARLAEVVVLEAMLERIAVLPTPRIVTDLGPAATDGFQLGILAACTVLHARLTENARRAGR